MKTGFGFMMAQPIYDNFELNFCYKLFFIMKEGKIMWLIHSLL